MESEDNKISLLLDVEEINILLLSLSKMPWDLSNDLINKIRSQSIPQVPISLLKDDDKKTKIRNDLLKELEK